MILQHSFISLIISISFFPDREINWWTNSNRSRSYKRSCDKVECGQLTFY